VTASELLTQGNRQTAEIRLDPVELGKVRVRMEIEGKDVRMYVTTENAGVRDVVAAGLDGLRRDLMAQGLQVQHVSVDVQADARSFGQHRHDERPEGDAATGERIGSDAAQLGRRPPPSAHAARRQTHRSHGLTARAVDLTESTRRWPP
jgi:flagellar hook-length control protein FliK